MKLWDALALPSLGVLVFIPALVLGWDLEWLVFRLELPRIATLPENLLFAFLVFGPLVVPACLLHAASTWLLLLTPLRQYPRGIVVGLCPIVPLALVMVGNQMQMFPLATSFATLTYGYAASRLVFASGVFKLTMWALAACAGLLLIFAVTYVRSLAASMSPG